MQQRFLNSDDPAQHLMQLLSNSSHGVSRGMQNSYNSVVQPIGQDIDVVSQTGSAYVGKSRLQSRAKSAVHSMRQPGKKDNAMKVYIPTDYYKHAGYI